MFSVTISNLDYAAVVFVYFLDFVTKAFHEQTVLAPLGAGVFMPETVTGALEFRSSRLDVLMNDDGRQVLLRVNSRDFGGRTLAAEFTVHRPDGYESINVVIPWADDTFQFTSKQPALPAAGSVQLGDERIDFEGFACLDYGRGIWPFSSTWNWASGSGVQNGRTIGLNLGGRWTDGTGMTENGLVVDGVATKIGDDLLFEYDSSDFMRPWRIRTAGSDAVDLEFVPFFERVAKTNALIVRSEVHQMIGRFHGPRHDGGRRDAGRGRLGGLGGGAPGPLVTPGSTRVRAGPRLACGRASHERLRTRRRWSGSLEGVLPPRPDVERPGCRPAFISRSRAY